MIQNFEQIIDKDIFALMNTSLHRFVPFGKSAPTHGRQIFIPQTAFMAVESQNMREWLSSNGYQKLLFRQDSAPLPSYVSTLYTKTHPSDSVNFGRSPIITICLMSEESLELLNYIYKNTDIDSVSFDGANWAFNPTLDILYKSVKMASECYKTNLNISISENDFTWGAKLSEAVAAEQTKTQAALIEIEQLKKQLEDLKAKPKRASATRGNGKSTT